ncbi:MAG: hypothetical protein HC905_30110 [Bacteroidales bacterium]|nr:hypothetical protein [Bacteroidales bacterium]
MQPVSHANGLHAALVMGEAIRTGFGASLRWDLANGWDKGNDHGMFSYGNEPGVTQFAPRPAFYTMYMFRKYFGDVMVKSTVSGSSDIVVFASKFNSGQAGAIVVNKGKVPQTVRINIENFKFGERYYTYTLTGGNDNGDFSRKTYINGIGPDGVAGGPLDYSALKANSSVIDTEIRVELPALSMVVFLAEKGDKTLITDETFSGLKVPGELISHGGVLVYPNPVANELVVDTQNTEYQSLEIN